MTVLTEDRFAGAAHYVVSEATGYRSRGTGVVASGAGALKAGAVLGQITATKKFVAFAPAASDGSQTAAAILFEGCDATSADVTRTLTLRDTEVHAEVLHFAEGVTDAQKTAALASLASHGIIAR
ncbi:MAG: head decoration protein [Pseudomonadota bacterium]|nr:head decoration protein [Pseudomonadota bacterium]